MMEIGKKGQRFSIKLNSLFVKILGYFLILLIPTLIISLVYYVNVVESNRAEFAERLGFHLRTAAETVDMNLSVVQAANQSFLRDKSTIDLLKPNRELSIRERAELPDLIDELNGTFDVMSNLVDSVFTYVDDAKVYSPGGIQDFDNFFANGYRYDRYDAEDWRYKLNHSNGFFEILPRSNANIFQVKNVPVIPFVSYGTINGNRVVVVANLSVSVVRQVLEGNRLFPATRFLVADASGNIVYYSAGMEVRHADAIVRQGEPGMENGKIAIEGADYLASFMEADVYGWKLYGLTPISEFKQQAAGLRNYILLICSVLMVVGFIIAFIFAFRIYNPIKKIHDILISSNSEQDSPGNVQEKTQLSTIGDRVHHFQQAYQRKLTAVAHERIESAMMLLLQGSNTTDGEVERLLSDHFGFRSPDYLCCNVFVEFKDKFYKDFQDIDRMNIMGKMTKVIAGLLKEYMPIFAFEYSPHMYVCLLNVNDSQGSRLDMALNAMMNTFRYDSTLCMIHVGVGKPHSGLSGIAKSYNEAMTALQHRDIGSDFQVLHARTLAIENRYSYSFTDENKILKHLRNGDLASARQVMTELVRSNEARNVSHPNIHLLITALYNTILRFGVERGKSNHELVTEEDHLMLSGITLPPVDAEKKLEKIIRLCEQLSERVVDPDSRAGNTVEAIIAYIENHYVEDIYLDTIAQEIGMSPKYVSRIFKEQTGINLTDCISMLRIAKAKELLLETQDNVNEIALQVGIYSRATFQRLFKKYAGVSPNEYRKSQEGEG